MTDLNDWPDPSRPCVPPHPERDSEGHVIMLDGVIEIYRWESARGLFVDNAGRWLAAYELVPPHDAYFGRIITPAEVAAREQASYQQGWGDREDDFIAGTERSGLIVMAPSELTAREQAAAVAMREACAKVVDAHAAAAKRCSEEADVIHRIRSEFLANSYAIKQAADDVRVTPLPTDALDTMLAQAKREGMEAAADICEESHALSGAQLAPCIRARAKEIKP